ncbi:hypothetical protein [Aureibacter tunicatorum]|uniref:Uncharacterized protein n=1 Tax=Aureibacter tunicatorum TaxID=866807 RepID=A0AAE3XNX6_9BACT|nr:hypothetical protein [Aureibacter tunicatorum]MDR6239355.1 hypothetical protein [Aureibacter tunicatorum]BDD04722.1 hypothetical protein AUTU_22050 [Aureibacter tunicatorum]
MKKENEEFFIGWNGKLGSSTKKVLKRTLGLFAITWLVFVMIFTLATTKAINSEFELYNRIYISGVFHSSPAPMLKVKNSGLFENILLVGFGKHGFEKLNSEISEEFGGLEGKHMSLYGNLIYYNGKTVFQVLDHNPQDVYKDQYFKPINAELLGETTLEGEIIDPKCYFGVMKPGRGRIHRSCAVRCLSGGIPPVFLIRTEIGNEQYYLLHLEQMKLEDFIPLVGKQIQLKGMVEQYEDWLVLNVRKNDFLILNENSDVYENEEFD